MILEQKNKLTKLHVSLPIWLKDLIKEASSKEGMSMSEYVCYALMQCARDTIEVPRAPDPVAPIPTVTDVLRNYVEGKDKLIGPCGNPYPCAYEDAEPLMIGSAEFCAECNVRTS